MRVWNITDDPGTAVRPTIHLVFGVAIPPGGHIDVDDEVYARAHEKLKPLLQAGRLYTGAVLPAHYLERRSGGAKALVPHRDRRNHGQMALPLKEQIIGPVQTEASDETPEPSDDLQTPKSRKFRRQRADGDT